MKILIADDSEFIRIKIRSFLEKFNYEVIEADNGFTAVELFNSEKPHIIIMDIMMPKLDGITAMQKILETSPNAVIIMMSSMGQQTKIIETIQKGATDFMTKPFDPVKLLNITQKQQLKLQH